MHDFMTQSRPFHGPIAQGPLNDPQDRSVWDVDVSQDIQNFAGERVAPFYSKFLDQLHTKCFRHTSRFGLGSMPWLFVFNYRAEPIN